jgi:hypothetical protein
MSDSDDGIELLLHGLARPDATGPDDFPRLMNMSAGFVYNSLPVPAEPSAPEYVYVPLRGLSRDEHLATQVTISKWNLAWESAQLRSALFRREDVPAFIQKVVDVAAEDANIYFLPQTRTRYREYAPLYHLLPAPVLLRNDLPLLRAGDWPDTGMVMGRGQERHIPVDFETRLGRAFAQVLWPRLGIGGRPGDYSANDPLSLLTHNLDFWLPATHKVLLEILSCFDRGPRGHEDDPEIQERLERVQGKMPPRITAVLPRMGGDLWTGEAQAAEVLDWIVEDADPDGRLRAVIDMIRSNRVHDDFSPYWSRDREDFERKINHSRAKVKVSFVELRDTIPVQAPYTDVEDDIVFGDFMALLDRKERRIVVLLKSGYTKVGEIASMLGYANHSPVSKRLARIRSKARQFFDQN